MLAAGSPTHSDCLLGRLPFTANLSNTHSAVLYCCPIVPSSQLRWGSWLLSHEQRSDRSQHWNHKAAFDRTRSSIDHADCLKLRVWCWLRMKHVLSVRQA